MGAVLAPCHFVHDKIFNDHTSIKRQLLHSFTLASLLLIGFTLMICYSLLYSLADLTIITASTSINNQIKADVLADAREIASSINQTMNSVGVSIATVSSNYMMSLTTSRTGPKDGGIGGVGSLNFKMLAPRDSYREYNFNQGSTWAKNHSDASACTSSPGCSGTATSGTCAYLTTNVGCVPTDYALFSSFYPPGRFDTESCTNQQTHQIEENCFVYGSMQDTSVYMCYQADSTNANSYCNRLTDTTSTTFSAQLADGSIGPTIIDAIDSFSLIDNDLQNMFSQGPNTTVMFYLSAKVSYNNQGASGTKYVGLHRTYPGIYKDADSQYDNTQRTWFVKAPDPTQGAVYLYGPYKETFTGQYVMTISSKQNIIADASATNSVGITAVGAAVMKINNIQTVINSIKYPKNGFGALLTNPSSGSFPSTIIWSKPGFTGSVYDPSINNGPGKNPGAFVTIDTIDGALASNLGQGPKSSPSTFTYTDAAGQSWVVSSVPFFPSTDGSKCTQGTCQSKYALIMLVFARYDLALNVLNSLTNNVKTTTSQVTIATLIFIFAITGGIMAIVFFMVVYITRPLDLMREVSSDIIAIAAEDEENKDYSNVVNKAFFDLHRSDEAGVLASEYFQIVCMLHNKNVEKKEKPKYPGNPFYVDLAVVGIDSFQDFAWKDFFTLYTRTRGSTRSSMDDSTSSASQAVTSPIHSSGGGGGGGELDVLSSMAASKYVKVDPIPAPSSTIDSHSIEMRPVESFTRTTATATTKVEVPQTIANVGTFSSIKFFLRALCATLLSGMLIVMIITVTQLRGEGDGWMKSTGADLETTEMLNLNALAYAKSIFVQSFFEQMATDVLVTADDLLVNVLDVASAPTTSPIVPSGAWLPLTGGSYLRSYAMDSIQSGAEFTYSYPNAVVGASYSTTMDNSGNFVSGYFSKTDIDSTAAANTQSSDETKALAAMDFKFQSLFSTFSTLSTTQSMISFVQLGLEDAYLRQFPYQMTALSSPTSCKIEDTTESYCLSAYNNIGNCANPPTPASAGFYPPYDPRCRSWYALGRKQFNLSPTEAAKSVYFGRPRISSSGSYVITAASPIVSKTHGVFAGVISFNYLVQTLSSAINSLPIMTNGYAYLIDATNTTQIILYPNAPKGCLQISCAEAAFSGSEYEAFETTVLAPIQSNTVLQTSLSVATTFQKGGSTWRLAFAPVRTGTIDYTLITVVPESDILASSILIQGAINATVVSMIAAFVVSMFVFCVIMFMFARYLSRVIVDPFHELKDICAEIIKDNLSNDIPDHSSSLDMRVLLDAFSNLIIALRFGSESYARGDRGRALTVFEDALKLYSATDNKRGIGASHNNLGAVKMGMGNLDAAEEHYTQAIANAESLLETMNDGHNKSAASGGGGAHHRVFSEADIARIRRVLSDRKGNLALLYLEKKEDREAYAKAFEILEKLLAEDAKNAYVKGCVVKQGSLGQFYLKQKEFKSAERIFTSALEFIRRKDEGLFNAQWNATETSAAEQIALCNIAFLRSEEKKFAEAESAYLETLIRPVSMNQMTTTMALNALYSIFMANGRESEATQLAAIAKREKFVIGEAAGGGGGGPKRVAFVVDYSGSMSGAKITSAIDNVLLIFKEHVSSEDQCMLMHFESSPSIDFPMLPKRGNEDMMQKKIDSLRKPGGATSFFDALLEAKNHFKGKNDNDWIIALTDGEDTTSRKPLEALLQELKATKSLNLIVIGIGSDVKTHELQAIAKTSEKGVYIFADGSKEGITKAFGQVAMLIQGQVMLEEL